MVVETNSASAVTRCFQGSYGVLMLKKTRCMKLVQAAVEYDMLPFTNSTL